MEHENRSGCMLKESKPAESHEQVRRRFSLDFGVSLNPKPPPGLDSGPVSQGSLQYRYSI